MSRQMFRAVQALPTQAAQAIDVSPRDRIFISMLAAYRTSGGLARLDSLVRSVAQNGDCAIPSVLRQVAEGAAFSFDWQQVFWVPMFQFVGSDLAPKVALRPVLGELAGVFDGWALATWFSSPNCWLANERPVDVLDAQAPQVLAAARVDRYIATG